MTRVDTANVELNSQSYYREETGFQKNSILCSNKDNRTFCEVDLIRPVCEI